MPITPSERLEALHNGEDPLFIARLRSGFAVMSNQQYLPGYSLLLAYPEVSQLSDLDHAHRVHFLEDMARLGDAVMKSTGCVRVNYAIFGNLDQFLHAHVWPRYASEPPDMAVKPPINYSKQFRDAPENRYHPSRHFDLQRQIAARLIASE
jgi:diadenosine tetraphosphate (Ap4A) HIT family hydrolase